MATTDTIRVQRIATLAQTHQTLQHLTSGVLDAALDFRPSSDEWSVREILAHLLDDEMFVMRTRMERMMKEENPQLASHDEKKWYSQRNKTRDGLTELLGDFAIQRQASLNMFCARASGPAQLIILNTASSPLSNGWNTGSHTIQPISSKLNVIWLHTRLTILSSDIMYRL